MSSKSSSYETSDQIYVLLYKEGLYRASDVLKLDRKLHSAYVKYNVWAGLVTPLDLDETTVQDVVYFHELFFFLVDNTRIVYDWTLSPKDTDLMFQLAAKTQKKKAQEDRLAKKKPRSN